MDPIKLIRFQKVIRYILSALFIVCVYHEAGPWMAISLLLIFIGSERQNRLNGIMIETSNNLMQIMTIHKEFHKKERELLQKEKSLENVLKDIVKDVNAKVFNQD